MGILTVFIPRFSIHCQSLSCTYPGVLMMFKDFLGFFSLCDVQVTLGWAFGAAEWFLCDPPFEYEP
jgi:hypothetical protein